MLARGSSLPRPQAPSHRGQEKSPCQRSPQPLHRPSTSGWMGHLFIPQNPTSSRRRFSSTRNSCQDRPGKQESSPHTPREETPHAERAGYGEKEDESTPGLFPLFLSGRAIGPHRVARFGPWSSSATSPSTRRCLDEAGEAAVDRTEEDRVILEKLRPVPRIVFPSMGARRRPLCSGKRGPSESNGGSPGISALPACFGIVRHDRAHRSDQSKGK